MYKPLAEVVVALSQRISDDKLKKVEKAAGKAFAYITWNDTARELDAVFGPHGWTESITGSTHDTTNGIYIVERTLTGYAQDGDKVVSFTRAAIGRAIAQVNRSGELTAQAHDTAIAAADSDSFSRAAKKLGDAFGLFLYDKDDPARGGESTSGYSAPRTSASNASSSDLGARPSDKQLGVLAKAGYTDEQVAAMPFKVWKAVIDSIFAKTEPPVAPANKKTPVAAGRKAASPPHTDADEDFPF